MTTYFTKEQIQQARQADLFDYLQANEPGVLKKDGRNYRHREHDSLVYVTAVITVTASTTAWSM